MGSLVPLEAAVVRRIQRLLKARNAWIVKTTGVSLVGCPDILACYKGRFIAIEVKRERNGAYGVTKKQRYELDAVTKTGGIAVVAYHETDVAEVLDNIDRLSYNPTGV